MNDLLGTVKVRQKGKGRDVEEGSDSDDEEEPTTTAAAGDNAAMEEFFTEVAAVKRNLERIKHGLGKLEKANEESKTVTRSGKMKDLRERMERAGEEVSRVAKETMELLKTLEQANVEARKQKGCGEGSSQDRTRSSITLSLHKKLRDLMGAFTELREKMQSEYKDVVERRYQAINGKKPTEDEVDELVETGKAETLWQSSLKDQGRGQVMDTVKEIQERHSAIKELERQLLGLHQIFLDMSVLVESQGEMLDNIETQVAKSVEFIHKGNQFLGEAKELQKNTRKWMCCLVMIMVTIVFVVVMAVIKPWKTGLA